jgi:PAS domain S-box-containing protein
MLQSKQNLTVLTEEPDWYYQDVINHIDDAVITTDTDFIITSWNHAAAKLHGTGIEEGIGKHSREFFNYQYIDCTDEEALETILREGKWRGTVVYNKPGGEVVYLESQVTRILTKDRDVVGFAVVSRDITQVYKTRTSLKNYISLLEGLNETYVVINSEFRIVLSHFKKAVKDLYGFSMNIGENFLDRFPKNRRPIISEHCRIAFSGSNSTYNVASEIFASFIQVSYLPLVSEPGYVDHICIVIKDISHEVNADKEEVEKYRREDRIVETRSLLEELMENSGFPAWISDRNGKLKYTNPAYVKHYGVGDENERIVNLLVKEFGSRVEDESFSFNQYEAQSNFNKNFPYPAGIPANGVFFPVYFNYKDLVACWEFNISEQVQNYEGLMQLENEKSRLVVRSIVETQEAEKRKFKQQLLQYTSKIEKYLDQKQQPAHIGTEKNDAAELLNLYNELRRLQDALDVTVVSGRDIGKALTHIVHNENAVLQLEIDELNLNNFPETLMLGIYRIVQAVDQLLKNLSRGHPTVLKITRVGEFIWIIIKYHSHLSLIEFLDHPDWKDIDIRVAFLEGNTEFNLDEIRINLPVR